METPFSASLSPTNLAQILSNMRIPESPDSIKIRVELKGFDMKNVTTYEEYNRMRDAIIEKTGHPDTFDERGRTALNVDAAAIAGAKLVIDNVRSTRSFTKRLATSGVNEDDFLYKGLSHEGTESNAAKAVTDDRKASQVESFIDFQGEIGHKKRVLKHFDMNSGIKQTKIGCGKGDGPTRRTTRRGKNDEETSDMKKGARKNPMMDVLKTPEQTFELNPLDDSIISDNYAAMVASQLREERKKKRRAAPVPFNMNLLDEEDD